MIPDLIRFEHKRQPMASRGLFIRRLGRNLLVVLAVIGISLIGGMIGYVAFEGLSGVDAFLEAAMLLGGMGPIHAPATEAGKLFAGIYALYAGILVIGTSGLILAPIFHRVLHSFHVEDDDEEKRAEKRDARGRRRT